MKFILKNKCPDSRTRRIKDELIKGLKEGLVIIPADIEVIRVNNYEVWGRDEFINYFLSKTIATTGQIKSKWNGISKGYNFVIAIYREDRKAYDMYSVKKFNELLNEEVLEETNVKEDM